MSSLVILIPVSIVLMCCAGLAFLWAVDSGQFDDLDLHALDLQEPDENDVGKDEKEQQR